MYATRWSCLVLISALCFTPYATADLSFDGRDVVLPEGVEAQIAEARERSMDQRMQRMQQTVATARDRMFPPGIWGDTLWALSALMVEEKVEEANALLLNNTNEEQPFAYFSGFDYVRILCLFGAEGQRSPGLLTAETEQAMKQVLFDWVRPDTMSEWGGISRVDKVTPEHVWEVWGSENHDLIKKSMTYLTSMLIKEDPDFRDRTYDDGHTPAEHFEAMNKYFKHWLRERALNGMWAEMGSSTYQKYSYPNLFNLAEFSTDPEVRRLARMHLDLSLIEEAQISINNRRGGGKSRGTIGSGLEPIKKILFGDGGGSTHTRVIEASEYIPPDIAFVLYYHQPLLAPYTIMNRVPGQFAEGWSKSDQNQHNHLRPDSALVNAAYRTPYYIIGCTLQNPNLEYTAISSQQRWSGIVFADHEAVYPDPEGANGLRWHDAYWGVTHQDVLIVQRTHRAYRTAKMRVFCSEGLDKSEEDGWIFADQGDAYAAVRILNDGYVWDDSGKWAILNDDYSPIIFVAGDKDAYESFAVFRAAVQTAPVAVEDNRLSFTSPLPGSKTITFFTNQNPYTLPEVGGETISLEPEYLYHSPFLRSVNNSDLIRAAVGDYSLEFDYRK